MAIEFTPWHTINALKSRTTSPNTITYEPSNSQKVNSVFFNAPAAELRGYPARSQNQENTMVAFGTDRCRLPINWFGTQGQQSRGSMMLDAENFRQSQPLVVMYETSNGQHVILDRPPSVITDPPRTAWPQNRESTMVDIGTDRSRPMNCCGTQPNFSINVKVINQERRPEPTLEVRNHPTWPQTHESTRPACGCDCSRRPRSLPDVQPTVEVINQTRRPRPDEAAYFRRAQRNAASNAVPYPGYYFDVDEGTLVFGDIREPRRRRNSISFVNEVQDEQPQLRLQQTSPEPEPTPAADEPDPLCCSICLESFALLSQNDTAIMMLNVCSHVFCEECLTRSVEDRPSCPRCRRDIDRNNGPAWRQIYF